MHDRVLQINSIMLDNDTLNTAENLPCRNKTITTCAGITLGLQIKDLVATTTSDQAMNERVPLLIIEQKDLPNFG